MFEFLKLYQCLFFFNTFLKYDLCNIIWRELSDRPEMLLNSKKFFLKTLKFNYLHCSKVKKTSHQKLCISIKYPDNPFSNLNHQVQLLIGLHLPILATFFFKRTPKISKTPNLVSANNFLSKYKRVRQTVS